MLRLPVWAFGWVVAKLVAGASAADTLQKIQRVVPRDGDPVYAAALWQPDGRGALGSLAAALESARLTDTPAA